MSFLKRRRIKNKIKAIQEIDPEEIFLDSSRERLGETQKLELPIKARNFFIFFSLITIITFIIWLRVFEIQIAKGLFFQKKAEQNRIISKAIYPPRGVIYDNRGKQLVFNLPYFSLMIRPIDILSNTDQLKDNIKVIESKLKQDKQGKLLNKLLSFETYDSNSYVLLEGLDFEEVAELSEILDGIGGLWIEKGIRRKYEDPYQAAHLLGYVGRISTDELEFYPQYYLNDFIGKDGLEKQYEDVLRGRTGRELNEVNFRGQILRKFETDNPIAGNSLVLSIDWELQKIFDQAMRENMTKTQSWKGAALAVDPTSGKILAFLSYPSYDVNTLSSGLNTTEFEKIKNDKNNPLFNRIVSGLYSPGSTIKPIIGTAALEENIISPTKTIFVSGSITIPSQFDPEQTYTFKDWKPHGLVDFVKAIAVSSNVYFYTIGGGYGDIKGLGIDKIKEYAYLFGLGAKLNIDLPGEKAGLIPDPIWKKVVKKEQWYIGDTYHISIGQGDILVTPLQLAMATATIANGGVLYQPQIVEKILSSQGEVISDNIPIILGNNIVGEKSLFYVKMGMRAAVTNGSARRLNDLPMAIAGKTGTVQVAGQETTNAWFTSFAPFDKPSIVLTILIEEGGEGSTAAVPVAEKVYDWYWENRM